MIVLLIVSVVAGLVAAVWYAVLCIRYALGVEYVKEHYRWQEIPSADLFRAVYEQLTDLGFEYQFIRFGESNIIIRFPTYKTVSRKNGWQRNILILPSWWEYRKFMRWEKNWKLQQKVRAEIERRGGNRSDDALRDMSARLEQKSQSGDEAEDALKVRDKIREILEDSGNDDEKEAGMRDRGAGR